MKGKKINLPARKSLMGMDSPLTGAPSMISYFATVSVSVVVLGPKTEEKNHTSDAIGKVEQS